MADTAAGTSSRSRELDQPPVTSGPSLAAMAAATAATTASADAAAASSSSAAAPPPPPPGTLKPRAAQTAAAASSSRPRDAERQARPSDIHVGNSSSHSPPPRMAPGIASASSPQRSSSPFHGSAASPSRILRSASPRHLSPATSQIFERDVQESVAAPELSPGIPSHIQTEDHIPPVLEASSLALTDSHLDPDEVEIVTHNAHQPAALSVAGGASGSGLGMNDSFASGMSSLNEMAAAPSAHEPDEASSTYGMVDPNDNRRLSFISFADVVHAEHAEGMREGVHPLSLSQVSLSGNRSPSPVRSPGLSSGGRGSPELSPVRGTGASISSGHGGGGGGGGGHSELTIETMRQALQKTGSNDVGSAPLSAVSADEGTSMPGRFPQ